MTTYYPNWKTQNGIGIKVKQLEFIGYGSRFVIDGVKYEEQKWRCRMPDGRFKVLKFRELQGDDSEVSHVSSDNNLIEPPNAIQCTKFEVDNNILIENNFMLRIEQAKKKRLLSILKREKGRGFQLYYRLLNSPSMSSLRRWREWKNDNPEEHGKFMTELWIMKSMT